MKIISKTGIAVFLIQLSIIINSCKKEGPAVVETSEIIEITNNSSSGGGNIISDGGANNRSKKIEV